MGSMRRLRPSALLALAIVVFLLLGVTNALAITRDDILTRAQTWIDKQVPYSQTKYFGGYRTDCSGFTSMSWKTTSSGHSYSYSTRSLHNVAHKIATDTLLPGDAMLRAGYHVRVFYGWLDDTHTRYVAYEQSGPTGAPARISIKVLASDIASGYVPFRYNSVRPGAVPWNAAVNNAFDTWVSGLPIWWNAIGSTKAATLVRTPKPGVRNAIRFVNGSSSTRSYVGVSQSATITAGIPYRLSASAVTSAPAAVSVTLSFLSASGATISTVSTSGTSWGVGPQAVRRMSVQATAPLLATRASYSVRLAGGVDASGSVGTTAVVDDVWLNDASPMGSSLTLSAATTVRTHAIMLRGRVTGPAAIGSVRIRVIRPGSPTPYTLRTVTLSGGAWSLRFVPKRHGTYRISAQYLGYGPFAAASSTVMSLRVK